MAQLETISIVAPGFFGLNTQASSVSMPEGFALEATNCTIDSLGRLGARKGWYYQTEGNTGVNLKGVHDFIDETATHTHIAWNDTTFYTVSGATLTAITYSGGNTINGVNWQSATLNDYAYWFDSNYAPVYFDPASGTMKDVSSAGFGTPPQGDIVLSAYGRLWVAGVDANRPTVYWSDLLEGRNFTTGGSGSLDLTSVLVQGNDEIVALAAHAGRLIILCKNSVVIYASEGSVLDPVSMQLVEVIRGTGCIARDSVQNTGLDVVFLSNKGLLSLGRLIQEKSQPERDLSKNIRDDFVRTIKQEDMSTIRSVYNPIEGHYLLLLPSFKQVYCFDTKQQLEDGSARITIWTNQTQSNMEMVDDVLWFTNADGIAVYGGYQDNGASYRLKYYTNYFDLGNAVRMKYLKRIGVTVIGGANQNVFIKAGFDYSNQYRSITVPVSGGNVAYYNEGEYNIAEYSTGVIADTVRSPMGGSGTIIQAGIEAIVNGAELSIQRLDVYVKQGRIL